jgi:hypothetical protein
MQNLRFLVTANVVPSSPIVVTLMMEALRSSETLILTRVTRHHIPEDGILLLFSFDMTKTAWSVVYSVPQ